jgi:hypothetical protein
VLAARRRLLFFAASVTNYSQILHGLTEKTGVRCINAKRMAAPFIFGLWLILATVAASTLTAWHSLALPVPARPSWSRSDGTTGWRVTHYLSSECACSRAVASYLEKRRPLAQVTEEVVLIDSGDGGRDAAFGRSLRDKKFSVELLANGQAASMDGVEGVPTLEIVSPSHRVVYLGGYRERGAPPGKYLDLAILSGLMAPKPTRDLPGSLPIYGCATSAHLRNLLDPLRLKSLNF